MKTVLYNKTTKQVIAGPFDPQYLVDGIPGPVINPIVELKIMEDTQPEFNPLTQNISSEWVANTTKKTRTLTWTVSEKSVEELAQLAEKLRIDTLISNGWHHPQFAKRIVAPVQLVMQYPAVETWFRINDLPIIRVEGTLYCYCNLILAAHQQLVIATQGIVTIEDIQTV